MLLFANNAVLVNLVPYFLTHTQIVWPSGESLQIIWPFHRLKLASPALQYCIHYNMPVETHIAV
jgi:hypothetical protein